MSSIVGILGRLLGNDKVVKVRPETCPEATCTLVSQRGSFPIRHGKSFLCCGRLDEVWVRDFGLYRHVNTHCFCLYSPLKGHTVFYVNTLDAYAMISLLENLIADEQENRHDCKGMECGLIHGEN